MSRKRPAPGTSPPYQVVPEAHTFTGHPEFSNDQFLQWSQNLQTDPQPNLAPNNDPAFFPQNALSASAGAQPPNQLVKAPAGQLMARSRVQNDMNGSQWMQEKNNNANTESPQREGAEEDDLPTLQGKALEAKKEAQSKRKQIPPFVQKLSSFLDQSKNTDLIQWADDGKSFIVLDEDEFAKTLIPELFKHNNYASFVRQLNMYGFHKKVGLADNSMRASERKNKSPSEYSHAFFRRGHPELLWAIQKPKSTTTGAMKGKGRSGRGEVDGADLDDGVDDFIEEIGSGVQNPKPRLAIEQGERQTTPPTAQLARLIQNELASIRHTQQVISHQIGQLQREHEQLSLQAASFQEQHSRHENSINAILTFLATVYDRSIRSNDSANIANLFGSMPQESTQGNVVDVGDYPYDHSTDNSLQRPVKKQPLLLNAPPATDDGQAGRATTMSPSATGSPYNGRPPRKSPQSARGASSQTPAPIEEVYDSNGGHKNSAPQQDIMSVIQNANARSTGALTSDFPSVLSSLENSGGSGPLSDSQRATMLRMINSTSNPTGNSNNALVSPNPPAMPPGYDARLASTSAEIDRLAKMQAEQNQSVQNLEKLLQPLSPNGSIPGIAGDQEIQVPPGLDLDEIFRTNDYFNGADSSMWDNKPGSQQGGNFQVEPFDDDLFGSVNANGYDDQGQNMSQQQFGNYNNESAGHVGGRVESVASSSEATSPVNKTDPDEVGEGDISPTRKRRRNE